MRQLTKILYMLPATIIVLILLTTHALGAISIPTQASVDDVVGAISTYGPVLGAMYAIYVIASVVVARYGAQGWLAQGKRLAIVVSVLGIAGAMLQVALIGSPWTVVLAAGAAAMFKLLVPTVPSGDPTAPVTADRSIASEPPTLASRTVVDRRQLGRLITGTIVMMACAILAACAGAGPAVASAVDAGINCEDPALRAAASQLLPAFEVAIQSVVRGDSVDKASLTSFARPLRDATARCAMDAAVALVAALIEAARGPTPSLSSASSATAAIQASSGSAVRVAWSEIRSSLGWPSQR